MTTTRGVPRIKNVLSNIADVWGFPAGYLRLLKHGGFLFLNVLNQDGLTSVARTLLRRDYRRNGAYLWIARLIEVGNPAH